MASVTQDRRFGVNAGKAVKVACAAATTANITLSGEQTIDGVAVVTDDRVLVWNQTDDTENGIYDVDTGAWTRSPDFDDVNDVTQGTIVPIVGGSTYASKSFRLATSGTITFGTTSLSFTLASFPFSTFDDFNDLGDVPTYISFTSALYTFSVPGDRRSDYPVGRWMLLNGSSFSNALGAVNTVAYTTKTTVTVYVQNDVTPNDTLNQVLVGINKTLPFRAYPILSKEVVSGSVVVTNVEYYYTNPQRYGAVGDGSTEDTTAINNKLSIGGLVELGEGTFIVDDLRLTTSCKIRGAGVEKTILKLKDSANNPIIQNTGSPQWVYLSDLTFDGNKANNSPYTGSSGIFRIAGADYIFVDRVRFKNIPETSAFYVRGASEHIYLNNFIITDTTLQGIAVTDGIDIHITNGYITATNNAGIDIEPNNDTDTIDGVYIDNVKIKNTGSYGISGSLGNLTAKTSVFRDINISNVDVDSPGQVTAANGSGIRMTDMDDVKISNTTVKDAAAHAYVLGAINFPTDGLSIVNIKADNAQKNGIQINGASGKTMTSLVGSNIIALDSNQGLSTFANLIISSYVQDYVLSAMHLKGIGAGGSNYVFGVTSIGNPIINSNGGMGTAIASAATIALTELHDAYHITGTTNIDTINGGWRGRTIRLIFDDVLTLGDGTGNCKLAGGFTTTADDTITLIYDGTSWFECSRSVN